MHHSSADKILQGMEPENLTYCFYAATTRGTIIYNTCAPNKIQFSKPQDPCEVTALEWGRENDILVGYKSGLAEIYSTVSNSYLALQKLEGEGPVVGLGCVDKLKIVAKEDGCINLCKTKKSDHFDIYLDEKATLNCMVHHKARQGVIGTGGEFNDFKLWNVETQQCIFSAKSIGHDQLNLPIPTSIRAITFLPESEHLSACATKEGHVLLYDDRVQRRPVVKFLEKKASYTCISTAFRERQCLVGTARGYMQLLDMKSPGKCVKTFKTFTGSVTSIACDPLEPLVVSTSLDRFLRIHNLETKELVHKVFLKQSLTKLLIKPILKKEESEDEIQEEEYEIIPKKRKKQKLRQ